MIKFKIQRPYAISILFITILGCIFITKIRCEYYWSEGHVILKAIENGSTQYDNDELCVDHGNITAKGREIVLGSGFTEQDIIDAQNTYNSTHSNAEESIAANDESKQQEIDKTQENSTDKTNENIKINTEITYTAEDIEATWEETDRIESTCTKTGQVYYTNSITGETKLEELPLTDHKYAETERKEATCTEAGAITYACEVCGDTYTEEIPALGHDYEWATTKEATLFASGEEQYVCKNCGDISETREISATCPIPLMGIIIGICVVLIGAVSGIVVLKKKRTIKEI